MYANANDYAVWLFLKAVLGLLDFRSLQHRFENDVLYTINDWCKFRWRFEKVRKMEVQITWSTLADIASWKCKNSRIQKDSKTFIWQRKYTLLDNDPSIFHFVRSKPISYNIHWGNHCGHWTLIGQLHREGQSMLHSINAFRIDIFATSGDPY